jgi:hypothetical protein
MDHGLNYKKIWFYSNSNIVIMKLIIDKLLFTHWSFPRFIGQAEALRARMNSLGDFIFGPLSL